MDPQRIPAVYWRDRLAKVRAMGLNTVFSYIFWNDLEPEEGRWLSHEPENDIATYLRTAQEEGLNVVLRPGPYICGEHEWGGFPAWLSQVPGMEVRSYNGPFLDYTRRYIERLANISGLADLQVSRGGPILMVQVENEYGSYADNHRYTAAMRDILRASFEVPLYTNDGGVDWTLEGGAIPHVLAEVDGGSWALAARDKYVTEPSELGPLLDGGKHHPREIKFLSISNAGFDNMQNIILLPLINGVLIILITRRWGNQIRLLVSSAILAIISEMLPRQSASTWSMGGRILASKMVPCGRTARLRSQHRMTTVPRWTKVDGQQIFITK